MPGGSAAKSPMGGEKMVTISIKPEDLAAELLKSSDAKIAAAAKRIFSRPPDWTRATKDAAAAVAVMPVAAAAAATGPIVAAPTGEGSVPYAAPPSCFDGSCVRPLERLKSLTDGVTAAVAAGSSTTTTESTTTPVAAASALTAMATAATASFASEHDLSAPPTTRVLGKKITSSERLQRSRERNRMHARKTRQRKKEQMQILQNRVDELKAEQLRLKQSINEKNTASILLGMFATNTTAATTATTAAGNSDDEKERRQPSASGRSGSRSDADADGAPVDPKVEDLLKRSVEDIPDASKIPELPALILPGQHSSKRSRDHHQHHRALSSSSSTAGTGASASTDMASPERSGLAPPSSSAASPLPQDPTRNSKATNSSDSKATNSEDGIDYELLGRDRSKCTTSELDRIRRERNRMHAKRTRDRKRIFMEEMEVIISQLEGENGVLESHLSTLLNDDGYDGAVMPPPSASASASTTTTPSLAPTSPRLQPATAPTSLGQPAVILEGGGGGGGGGPSSSHTDKEKDHGGGWGGVERTLSSEQGQEQGKKRPLEATTTTDGGTTSTTAATEEPADETQKLQQQQRNGITVEQIKSILSSAGVTVSTAVSAQNSDNDEEEEEQEHGRGRERGQGSDRDRDDGEDVDDDDESDSPRPARKRRCLVPSSSPMSAWS